MTITMQALIKRINRKLKPDFKQLKVPRGARARQNLGDFYLVDLYRNFIDDHHVDPVVWGREMGCLGDHETVIE